MKTVAQRAFEAWCSGPGSAVDPAVLDAAWNRCSPATQAAWERVARAIGPDLFGFLSCDFAALEERIMANPNAYDPNVKTGRGPSNPPDPWPVPGSRSIPQSRSADKECPFCGLPGVVATQSTRPPQCTGWCGRTD